MTTDLQRFLGRLAGAAVLATAAVSAHAQFQMVPPPASTAPPRESAAEIEKEYRIDAARHLYALYPDYWIDRAAEQAALAAAQAIVWLHPVHWYGMPPLLKLWLRHALLFPMRLSWTLISDLARMASTVLTHFASFHPRSRSSCCPPIRIRDFWVRTSHCRRGPSTCRSGSWATPKPRSSDSSATEKSLSWASTVSDGASCDRESDAA